MKMYAGADMIKGSSKASQLLLKVKVGGGVNIFVVVFVVVVVHMTSE